MIDSKSMSNEEKLVAENVANKLNFFMKQHKLTLHGLASRLGFAYQAMWRIVNKKHSPTVASLAMIVQHFGCTISELIDEKVFIDIPLHENINQLIDEIFSKSIRVYIPYNKFIVLDNPQLFAIKNLMTAKDFLSIRVFTKVLDINVEGLYLIIINDQIEFIEVISTSTQYIWAVIAKKEVKISKSDLKVIGRFLFYLSLIDHNNDIILGVVK